MGVKGKLNEVSSGQKLYREFIYNARHRVYSKIVNFWCKINKIPIYAVLPILLKLICIYFRFLRIVILTFYIKIRPINHLLISLGPIQVIS